MNNAKELYTGFLKYKGIDFSFIFANNELRLIPSIDKSTEIQHKWLMKEIGNGVYTNGDPLLVEEESIIATCNETNGSIIFLPRLGSVISSTRTLLVDKPPVLKISLSAYIMCRFDRDAISRISFIGPEINYIHPVNQAFSWIFDEESNKQGIIKIETRDFSSTTTEEHYFSVDSKIISSKFGISRGVSMEVGETPLSLKSSLIFEFEPSNDYQFILQLCSIAKDYISYLCYRKNIVFDEIELSAPYEGGKYEKFASLFIIDSENEPDESALKRKRNIKQMYINDGETRILQDIADNSLYLRHLPTSYTIGRHIDASRFVMIVAAFEWEFRRMKPDGLQKSEKRQKAEKEANITISKLIDSSTGKEKEIYKFLRKFIGAASLQNEIENACEELDQIVGVLGRRLYKINGEGMSYSDIGHRLAEQRNHFAHGDIDKDFIGTSLLDLIFLEYVIYAMQLKYYGISDMNIQKSINELFHLNFAI